MVSYKERETSTCRLCATDGIGILNIFDERGETYGGETLDIKVRRVLRVMVTEDDPWPNMICMACFRKLNLFGDFLCSVVEAQAKLRALIPEKLANRRILHPLELSAGVPISSQASGSSYPAFTERTEETATITPKTEDVVLDENFMSNAVTKEITLLRGPLYSSASGKQSLYGTVANSQCINNKCGDRIQQLSEDQIKCEASSVVFDCMQSLPKNETASANKSVSLQDIDVEKFLKYEKNCIVETRGEFVEVQVNDHTADIDMIVAENPEVATNDPLRADSFQSEAGSVNGILKEYEQCSDSEVEDSVCIPSSSKDFEAVSDSQFNTQDATDTLSMDEKLPPANMRRTRFSEKIKTSRLKNSFQRETIDSDKKYTCALCSFQTCSASLMQQHTNKQHSQSTFCNICNKTMRKSSFNRHNKDVHASAGKYICTLCPYKGNRSSLLQDHMDTVHVKSAYCDICKMSMGKSSLILHNRTVHDTKVVSCMLCKSTHKNQYYLSRHLQKMHQKERPYFAKRTETESYICNFCNKSFVRKQRLMYHINIHMNRKPYKCTICHKSFFSGHYLGKHKQSHSTRYSCQVCHKKFSYKWNITDHINRHHT